MRAEEELFEQIALLEKRRTQNKLDYYEPYEFQRKFHNAKGYLTNLPATEKCLLAANQVGKTLCAGNETAIHLTGLYPSWWEGTRFYSPVAAIAAGVTNELTRDLCQKELLGAPEDEKMLGTGTIPKHLIGKTSRKAGVPNAYESVRIRHASGGWSVLNFKCYEQGPKKFMGIRVEVSWCDEEPPADILSQIRRAAFSRQRSVILLTMTPEEGMTETVVQFLQDPKRGQAVIRATWDDAPHMTPEVREAKLATIPKREREMRTKGIPFMGSGMVFQIPESEIEIEDIKIQDWWPRIVGIDFGIDHKFAAVWIAWDRDADCVYVYDVFAASDKSMPDHVSALKRHGDWIPVVWPHDGLMREKSSGKPLAELYRQEGANMRTEQFSNPPAPGQKEGEGGNSVEYGIAEIEHRMQTGRFKVVRRAKDWWDEFRMYHRKDGKIVALNDDVMSATRYAALSLRHAITRPVKTRRSVPVVGVSNW